MSKKAFECQLLPKVYLNSKFAKAYLVFIIKTVNSIFIFHLPSNSMDLYLNWNWTSEIHTWRKRKYRPILISLSDISLQDNDTFMSGFTFTFSTFPKFFFPLTLALMNFFYLGPVITSFLAYCSPIIYMLPIFRERGL